MKNITKRDCYSENDFDEMLENSDLLVENVVSFLKTIYPENDYEIISGFDNNKLGIVNILEDINLFSELEKKLLETFILYRFGKNSSINSLNVINYLYKKQIVNNEIFIGMRCHDIAIIERKTNNIIELIECKDFPQLIFFPETGLPVYYLFKLTFLKCILEKRQKHPIRQSFIFQDNVLLKENRIKNKISIPIKDKLYGLFLNEENLKGKSIKKNKNKEIVPSHFLKKFNYSFIPESAHKQFTWNVFKDMKNLEKLFF